MTTRTKCAKCPQCCPAGGAIFRRTYDDEGRAAWKCNNCHLTKPVRKSRKATGKKLIAALERFGWQITKREYIGNRLWIEAKHPTRSWVIGDSTYGSVGPNGKFKLACTALCSKKTITDYTDVHVYLGS